SLAVEGQLATGQLARQVAEHYVGVGDGRFSAAGTVRGRPGYGTGRLRPYPQRLRELGHVCDRAATGSDCAHVDRRRAYDEVADAGLATHTRSEVLYEGDIGRSAAHVEREEVGEAGLLGDSNRTGHSTGRPRHQHRHGILLGRLGRDQTAVATQNVEASVRAGVLQLGLQMLDVPRDTRLYARVGDGGDGAFVLPQLGQHRRRQGDLQPG